MDIKNTGDKIRKRRRALGWTGVHLAGLVAISPGFLSRIEAGKIAPGRETLSKLAGMLGVPLEEFYKSNSNVEYVALDYRHVPLLDYVQAGQWRSVDDSMKEDWVNETIPVNMEYPPSTFGLRIAGDSMLPRFMPGDVVIIDVTKPPTPGKFVVAQNADGEATFKQYKLVGKDQKGRDIFELVPLNPVYPTLRSDQEPIAIVGVMREHRIYDR